MGKSDCSCEKLCIDYTVTKDQKNKLHHVGRGCDKDLRSAKKKTRTAVLSSGQWRIFTRPIQRLPFDAKTKEVLIKLGVTTVFQSHEKRVLEPLRKNTGAMVNYFLCVDELGKNVPDFITEAWSYQRGSQIGRIKACLKRVLLREKACADIEGANYAIFVRIRPDFFVFTDLPDPRTALTNDCVMNRFRMASSIGGLTNDHLSFCFCGIRCCNEGSGNSDTPGFVVDDMVSIVPRKYANAIWTGKLGPYPFPTTWSPLPNWFESHLTRMWITQGIKVCPLPFRGLPMGSPLVNSHVSNAMQCGYAAGGKKMPQTQCGTPHATRDTTQKLTPGNFIVAE